MYEIYKPSGKFSPSAFAWLFVAAIVGAVAAFAYQFALRWIPLVYINFLLTVGMAYLLGILMTNVIVRGHVRNRIVGIVCMIVLVLTTIGAKFGFQYYLARSELKTLLASMTNEELQQQINQTLTPDQAASARSIILDSYTFPQHLQQRIDSGWQIGRVRVGNNAGNPISGFFVILVWLIEAGIMFFIAGKATFTAVSAPYSEKLGLWADHEQAVMTLPISDNEMLAKIRNASSVQELLDIPVPKSLESHQLALYRVKSVPEQPTEDAFLAVTLHTNTVNKKGEVEVKSEWLVRNAILTASQREQLQENSEILAEALAAYQASLQQATSTPASTPPSDET